MTATKTLRQTRMALAAFSFCAAFSAPAHADDAALKAEVDALSAEVAALQAEVRQMHDATRRRTGGGAAAATAAPAPQPAPTTSVAASQSGSAACRILASPSAITRRCGATASSTTTIRPAMRPTRRPTSPRGHRLQPRIQRNDARLRRARMGARRHVGRRSGRSEVEQLYVEHSLNPIVRRARRPDADSARLAQRASRADQLLRRRTQFRRDRDHSDDVARRRLSPARHDRIGLQLECRRHDGPGSCATGIRPIPKAAIRRSARSIRNCSSRTRTIVGVRRAELAGVPGLKLGGGVFTGKIGQATSKRLGDANFPADDARLDARRSARALAAGSVRFLRAVHARHDQRHRGAQPDVPRQSVAGSEIVLGRLRAGRMAALEWTASSLVPFVRYEAFNTAASFASVPLGLGVPALPTPNACGRSASTTT